VKRKTARRFAERLYGFLSSAPEADIVDRNGVNLARFKIDTTVQGLETADIFAGYVKADHNANAQKADDWDFVVDDEENNEVTLRYHSMEKDKSDTYFLFSIVEESDETADDTKGEAKEQVETEQVRSG